MKIDKISSLIIKLALYLENLSPGSISEIWIDKKQLKQLEAKLPKKSQIEEYIFTTNSELSLMTDKRRKAYLSELMRALAYQINMVNQDPEDFSLAEFTKNCFGMHIDRVDEAELIQLESRIKSLESRIKKDRFQIIEKREVDKRSTLTNFRKELEKIKKRLMDQFNLPESENFSISKATKKPWSAFNKHIAPFTSELYINTDLTLTDFDISRLAVHEGYGGHHLELSLKDKMLVEQGRGEHGIVITYSPQTFISEAIAECGYIFFDFLPKKVEDELLFEYTRLTFALQNRCVYWFFEDGMEKKEIKNQLDHYYISEETKTLIINFATDEKLGIYALVYNAAYNFLKNLYDKAENKEQFLLDVYTQPCTPNILSAVYSR